MTGHIKIARGAAALMTIGCLIWNLDILNMFGFAPIEESFQAFVLGLALTVTFLTIGTTRKSSEKLPWYDLILSVATISLLLYVSANFLRLKEEGYANSTNEVIVIGAILTFMVLEGLRRSAGYVLLCVVGVFLTVVGVFLTYAPLAHLVPGELVGLDLPLWQIGMNFGFNPNAIFGLPLVISTTIVIMFINH